MKHSLILILLITFSCNQNTNENPLLTALNSDTIELKSVMDNLEDYEVQIKLSKIVRLQDSVSFEDFEFQINDNVYFYPASTVKFPVSILTLEKLNEEQTFTIDTPFIVEGDTVRTTFRKDIIDIFAVSSNATYNRLFEFLSKDYINKKLKSKGLSPSRISHRLSTIDANNLKTRSFIFTNNDSTITQIPSMNNKAITKLNLDKIKKGVGYYANDTLINEPMDFSSKNYLPINTLHNTMKRIIFPNSFKKSERFNLSKEQRSFIIETMAFLPKNGGYIDDEHYDSYVKFFIYGDSKNPIPDHIKIHNKVGYAYGYLTDCAYIKDMKNNIEYILTATIHVNKNGVFNDDIYEYDDIGMPFLAALGREIHSQLSQ